jgi:DNA-binding NarL/FixJ family response regulator
VSRKRSAADARSHLAGATLPAILQSIAEIAGEDAALRVAEARGGQVAYIPLPDNLSDDHWLVGAAGRSKAREIAAQLGGRSHVIPIGSTRRRQDEIQRLVAEGLGTKEIALRLRIDRRTVRRHVEAFQAANRRAPASDQRTRYRPRRGRA